MKSVRSAIITGAEGGIGVALCSAFKAAGYRVIATDVGARSEQNVADVYLSLDLGRLCRDDNYRSDVLSALVAELQGSDLHALVNNAATQIVKPVADLELADWNLTMDVNLLAPFVLTQHFLPQLTAAGGSVINIASIHAQLTKPEFVCYATSKAALVGMTKAMAVELGGRVRVNAICPAAIATPMLVAGFSGNEQALAQLDAVHPVGRIGRPSEVADAAVFLASDAATFMNGASLELDGGISSCLHDPGSFDCAREAAT